MNRTFLCILILGSAASLSSFELRAADAPATPPETSGSAIYVWWEAENPKETTFKKTTWPKSGGTSISDLFSGGDALTHETSKKKGEDTKQFNFFAKWEVDVPADGTYTLWSREQNKTFMQYDWKFDDGPWTLSDYDLPVEDPIPIGKYGATIGWSNEGKVALTKGKHIFEVLLTGSAHKGVGEHVWAVFDCFLLTTGKFVPHGKDKPQ